MENLFIELVKMLNPIQLVATGLVIFYFYNRQKDEIKEIRTEIREIRTEIKDVESSLRNEIKDVESSLRSEIRETNSKLDTFLLALFSKGLPSPVKEDKDAA